MSIFKKWSKRNKINNGQPYSFEELMGMDDTELGALYRGYGEISAKKEEAIYNFEGFSACMGMTLFGLVLPTVCLFVFPNFFSFDSMIIELLALLVPFFIGVIFGSMIGTMVAHLSCTAYSKAKNFMVFDDVKKSDMKLKDIQSLVDDSIQVENRTVSKFLRKVKKTLWMGKEEWMNEPCHLYDYPDEDLGLLVKILLPIMKLDHDGGSLNNESFKVLDDELHLSERIDSFNNKIPDIRNRIEEEKIRKEKEKEVRENNEKIEKKRKVIDDSVNIANSMLNRLNADHDRNKTLEEHSEFKRIKDLNKKLDEQKTRLDVSLASQHE